MDNRRLIGLAFAAGIATLALAASAFSWPFAAKREPIKVGILHSITGHMAATEKPLVDAVMLAISEVNESGGILGAQIVPVVADGRSDDATFKSEAERLIRNEKAAVISGCWTSSCRKAVKPVVEKADSLLVYPLQYEGMESSPNIFYTGSTPNQQIIPAVNWALETFGANLYLAGSDYVFPRTANLIIRKVLQLKSASVAGERYLPLGSTDVDEIIADIASKRPNAVINTINGATNLAFFTKLKDNPATRDIPVISFSLGEPDIALKPGIYAGHYASWSYFQSIDSEENRRFITSFKKRFGQDSVISDPMEAAYIGLKLWARAVNEAGSLDTDKARRFLIHQSIEAPQGIVSVSRMNQHLWKGTRIGKIRSDGQFETVWSEPYPVRPNPYPKFLTKAEWADAIKGIKE